MEVQLLESEAESNGWAIKLDPKKKKLRSNGLRTETKIQKSSMSRSSIRKERTRGIHTSEGWEEDPEKVKSHFFSFFKDKFDSTRERGPTLGAHNFAKISIDDACMLERPFEEEGIWAAIRNCGDNKSPGPNGFTFGFLKKFWSIIKEDLMKAISWFWDKEDIGKGCNPAFLTLSDKRIPYEKRTTASRETRMFLSLICNMRMMRSSSDNGIKLFGIGVSEELVKSWDLSAGCGFDKFPFIYLDLPVGASMKRVDHWKLACEKLKKRLNSWKSRFVSFGGRLTLVKTVLGSLPLYLFSLFRAPSGVLKLCESERCRFFWGGGGGEIPKKGNVWVNWVNTVIFFEGGGLNIGSLDSINLSLLGKWSF
ncbi:LOW QUALITY PROTEIN: hypothetical protein OSB04_030968 [Centaurea solstitialis]|uniref:Uncharacterized protein n=1 Tax=Centaurea solstitialis TaxID=347529 RepID=A0AA38W4B0_9ASTR|nr:LOW QUALITY PROTEIN: hypothetical protein OSB04_030968 [Centaurea solstitialis]